MLEARRREHEENHVRRPELQILDALLRIEELLTKPAPITLTPDTPAVAATTAGKRKGARQL